MADRPCFAVVTDHGCIVAVGATREAAVEQARLKGRPRGCITVASTVVNVRSRGKWAWDCEICRRRMVQKCLEEKAVTL